MLVYICTGVNQDKNKLCKEKKCVYQVYFLCVGMNEEEEEGEEEEEDKNDEE